MRGRAATVAVLLVLAGCGGEEAETDLATLPIMAASIVGTANSTVEPMGDGRVFRRMDVVGDWNAVSATIADVVQENGWTVESVNCVGTGNDVIARRQVDGRWVLLEAGAGERGAGVILSVAGDQRPSRTPLEVTGRCPRLLVDAARS